MKRGRGRPPKSPFVSIDSRVKRFRSGRGGGGGDAGSSGGTPASSRSSTPVHSGSSRTPSREMRSRAREAAQRSKQLIHEVMKVVGGHDEGEEDVDDVSDDLSEEESDESDYAESESALSVYSESSFSTVSSSKRRYIRHPRPKSPVVFDDEREVPPLTIPKSGEDLLLPTEHLMDAIAVYEVIRHFRIILRVSPFRFEDFCAALLSQEQCSLIAEIHIALLKALIREDEQNSTTFGPHDLKDSINIKMYYLDAMTWPELVRCYVESDKEFRDVLPSCSGPDWPYVPLDDKLKVLRLLTDQVLVSNAIRDYIYTEGTVQYDDHCRVCHKLGDLLCCETCSAVYHLECVRPPLEEVPEDDWLCEVCVAHQVGGVTDCVLEAEKTGQMSRQEPLGYDRHGRKYWFLCRRVVVESDTETWYYSTKLQLQELLETLDTQNYERDLCMAVEETKDELVKHMDVTERLTNEARGNQRSIIQSSNEEIEKRLEEKRKLEEEKRKKEEEEALKRQEEMRKREEEFRAHQIASSLEQLAKMTAPVSGETHQLGPLAPVAAVTQPGDTALQPAPAPSEVTTVAQTTTEETTTTTSTSSETTKMEVAESNQEDGTVTSSVVQVTQSVTTTVTTVTKVEETKVEQQQDGDSTLSSTEKVLDKKEPSPEKTAEEKEEVSSGPTVVSLQSIRSDVKERQLDVTENSSDDKGTSGTASSSNSVAVTSALASTAASDPSQPVQPKATVIVMNKDGTKVTYAILPKGTSTSSTSASAASSTSSTTLTTTTGGSVPTNGTQTSSSSQPTSTTVTTSSDADTTSSSTGSSPPKTRMVTRLQNPESKLSQRLAAAPVASTANLTGKGGGKDSILVINAQGEIKQIDGKGSSMVSHLSKPNLFRLGQEGKFRMYVNQYTSNQLALNKHQHAEDRDRRRGLTHKFCLNTQQEFKWQGTVHGNKALTVSTLRLTLVHLENAIPKPFLHPHWATFRTNWIKAVHMCTAPKEFALALSIFESVVKPCVLLNVWRDSLGHVRLQRVTALEKDDKKKKKDQGKLFEEEEVENPVYVKYTIPLKHQVWKLKGEEYRITGMGGWMWLSSTRTPQFQPALPVPDTTKPLPGIKDPVSESAIKEAEAAENCLDAKVKVEEPEISPVKQKPKAGEEPMDLDVTGTPVKEENMEVDHESSAKRKEKAKVKVETPGSKGLKRKADYWEKGLGIETINVSEGLKKHLLYKKLKPTKLDGFLDRREKQFDLEQRQILSSGPQGGKVEGQKVEVKKEGSVAARAAQSTTGNKASVAKTVTSPAAVTTSTASLTLPALSAKVAKPLPAQPAVKAAPTLASSPEKPADKSGHVSPEAEPKTYESAFKNFLGIPEPIANGELNSSQSQMNSMVSKEAGCHRCYSPSCLSGAGSCYSTTCRWQRHRAGSNVEADKIVSPERTKQLLSAVSGKADTNTDTNTDPDATCGRKGVPNGSILDGMVSSRGAQLPVSGASSLLSSIVSQSKGQVPAACSTAQTPCTGVATQGTNAVPRNVPSTNVGPTSALPQGSNCGSPVGTVQGCGGNDDNSLTNKTQQASTQSSTSVTERVQPPLTNCVGSASPAKTKTTAATVPPISATATTNTAKSLPLGNGVSSTVTTVASSEGVVRTVHTVTKSVVKTTTQNSTHTVVRTQQSSTVAQTATVSSTVAAAVNSTKTETNSKVLSKCASSVATSQASLTVTKSDGHVTYSTTGKVYLAKFTRVKKKKSQKVLLPSSNKFSTRVGKKSIFILPPQELRKLARRGANKEVACFKYDAKMVGAHWPYLAPRPTFRLAWRYHVQILRSLSSVASLIRVLWACLRWEDMSIKPPTGTSNTITTETEITTTEITKRRDVGTFGLRSDYCVRKIICPINTPSQKETHRPQRKGLRSSSQTPKAEVPQPSGPMVIETWVPEEDLELWEIRQFAEKLEKQQEQARQKVAQAEAATKAEQMKAQLEVQLKQQRQAMQQKRLQEQATKTKTQTPLTPQTTPKVVTVSITPEQMKLVQSGGATPVTSITTATTAVVQTPTGVKKVQIPVRRIITVGGAQAAARASAATSGILGTTKTTQSLLPAVSKQTFPPYQPQGVTATLSSTPTSSTMVRLPISQLQQAGGKIQFKTVTVQAPVLGQGQTQVIQGQGVSSQGQGQVLQAHMTPQGVLQYRLIKPTGQAVQAQVVASTQGQAVQSQTAQIQVQAGATSQTVQVPVQTQQQVQAHPQVVVKPSQSGAVQGTVQAQGQAVQGQRLILPAVNTQGATVQTSAASVAGQVSGQPLQGQATVSQTPGMQTQPLKIQTAQGQTIVLQPQSLVTPTGQAQLLPGQQIFRATMPDGTVKHFIITPKIVTQTVQPTTSTPQPIKNVVSLQTPSVQQKILQMQQQHQQQQLAAIADAQKKDRELQQKYQQQLMQKQLSDSPLAVGKQAKVQIKQNKLIENLRAKQKTLTPEEREDNQRMIVCNQVMKHILDTIDREEKADQKKRKKEETAEQKRSKAMALKLQTTLFKHKEQLRKDMLKKRSLMEKEITKEVQDELKHELKKKGHKRKGSETASSGLEDTPKKKKKAEKPAKAEGKSKMIRTSQSGRDKDRKLYCVCKTPYDATQFYIGCDLCSNWFHGACVNITEKQAEQMDSYTCPDCSRLTEDGEQELYCLCRTPYDETQFYIGCDRCNDWFHGRCVGILPSEADEIDYYICPNCQSSKDMQMHNKSLSEKDTDHLKRLLKSLQSHKMAWPFVEPVSELEVPDYYQVIKEPMDLSTVEKRLRQKYYKTLNQYVADISKIFDNCRYYNPSDSAFCKCAEVLEGFFLQKLKTVKSRLGS
ncbi:nucleosome-remodeling factor subunit BPTF-like isoform X2 [Branchiostoma lanceolatum]|uniref:nucleosome-remodeling factor subunit BPTF-like isoform X2 n=1 Tax=Branchiostoma lanceolatum TaxID=7740 RepID=UPI00345351FA